MRVIRLLVLIIAGGALVVFGILQVIKGSQSNKWPVVVGTVVDGSIHEQTGKYGRKSYNPVVDYQYIVNGKTYQSSREAFGESGSSSSLEGAKAHLAKFPVGSKVQVHYNQADPSEATLKAGIANSAYAIPGLGLVMLVIGVAMMAGGSGKARA